VTRFIVIIISIIIVAAIARTINPEVIAAGASSGGRGQWGPSPENVRRNSKILLQKHILGQIKQTFIGLWQPKRLD